MLWGGYEWLLNDLYYIDKIDNLLKMIGQSDLLALACHK